MWKSLWRFFLSNCDEEPVICVVKELGDRGLFQDLLPGRDLQGEMVSIKLVKLNRALDTNTSKTM